MGGVAVKYELVSIEALGKCLKAYQIFREAWSIEFFEWLKGLDESVDLEFARNLNRNQTEIKALWLEITEEVIVRVTTLWPEGKRWFNRKTNGLSLKAEFLQGEEQLVKKGRVIDRLSIPQSWNDVALFIIK